MQIKRIAIGLAGMLAVIALCLTVVVWLCKDVMDWLGAGYALALLLLVGAEFVNPARRWLRAVFTVLGVVAVMSCLAVTFAV